MRADSRGFWIATASGMIGLEEVQLENKQRLPGTEFIKGARIKTGDRLGMKNERNPSAGSRAKFYSKSTREKPTPISCSTKR